MGIFKQHGSKVESDLLFTVLEDRLNNDFNTHEEDGSTEWLSKFLVTLYRDCEKENYEGLLKMKAAHDESHPTPQVHALNDGDTDDEDDFHADTGLNTVSEQMNGLSMESADNVNNDTDVKEEAPVVAEEAPAVDADGWSTVTSKKNRRRRK